MNPTTNSNLNSHAIFDMDAPLNLEDSYRKLYTIRRAEQKIQEEYFNDEMKTPVHLGIGAEAITVGVLQALPKDIKAFGTYRNHSLYLALSEDLEGFFGEMYGKMNGSSKGKAGSMHMMIPEKGLIATSAVVATTIPLAVGAALANKYKGINTPTVVFFGDGATEEGAFYESLNFASLHKLNVIFVCEDNDLAIHASSKTRRGFKSFKDFVAAFDCAFEQADGTDLLSVYQATQRLMKTMKKNGGPGFIHADYFRFLEHVGPMEDFKFGYREKPQGATEKYDPVLKFQTYLESKKFAYQEIQKLINEKVNQAVVTAQKAPLPPSSELFTDVLAES